MTNRSTRYSYSAPSSARMAHANVKKPRLRRVEISFSGPNGPLQGQTTNNGFRSHGGTRGSNKHPPGQFSYNKEPDYEREIQAELEHLIGQDYYTSHGSPVWLNDVNREITHSGESPLFVHRLLAPGKFEQEHGIIKYDRALLHTNTRRSSAPSSRAGDRKYYRPNRTHQFLSATDLRNITDESALRYGRPTRTTLLRARSKSSSAPVNAYDIRREMQKRSDDVKHNSIFVASKDVFEREHNRLNYRIYNIYANDGETMHSFLTGARYNRAHLLDSKGLSTYGVYMPRNNPHNCFMAGNAKLKDHGEDIPSAPPDSPRSDIDEHSTATGTPCRSVTSQPYFSRPPSSHPSSRPSSSKTFSQTTGSRPQSKSTTRMSGSRPRSAKEYVTQQQGYHIVRKNLSSGRSTSDQVTEEYTTIIPDAAKAKGVYVTLKGQKMVEMAESRLPRVTGISVPKLRKPRDPFEEIQTVNQPPPTPIDLSTDGAERNKYDRFSENSNKDIAHVTFDQKTLEHVSELPVMNGVEMDSSRQTDTEDVVQTHNDVSKTNDVEQLEDKSEQSILDSADLSKQVNGQHLATDSNPADAQLKQTQDTEDSGIKADDLIEVSPLAAGEGQSQATENGTGEVVERANGENIVFFITEEKEDENKKVNGPGDEKTDSSIDSGEEDEDEAIDGSVPVIRVEVSETEKNNKVLAADDGHKRITADDFPFTEETELKGGDNDTLPNGEA